MIGLKEMMWKPIQKAMFGKGSTTQLKKQEEIDKIIDVFVKFFAEKFQQDLPPFPEKCELCGGIETHSKGCPNSI